MSERDILKILEEDTRMLRLTRPLPADGPLTWEQIRGVQVLFNKLVTNGDITLADAARKMGKGYSQATLVTWRYMKPEDHEGNRDAITRAVASFLENEARKSEVPRNDEWVETAVARRMMTVIHQAVTIRTIGLIYSDAGRGKTMTLEAAKAIVPGAVLLRVRRTSRSVAGLAAQLADTMQLRGARTTRQIQSNLVELLKGTERLLMIDEAHQLTHDALEFLRDLHDECGCPIVLAGTLKINDMCDDFDSFFGQFNRRIGLRCDVTEDARVGNKKPKPLHTIAEIKRLFHTEKLHLTTDGAALLTRIANVLGLGGLGLVRQITLVASRLPEKKPLDAKLALHILRQMHGKVYTASRIERAIAEQKEKVA